MESEDIILSDLNSGQKSFRLFALENAIKSGKSPRLLEELNKRNALEADAECCLLLKHAIQIVGCRLEKTEVQAFLDHNSEEFLNRFKEASRELKLTFLSTSASDNLKKLGSLAPDLILGESDPVVQAAILRTFTPFWPMDRKNLISEALRAESLNLRLAALESLVVLAPETLLQDLPELLVSRDPRLRALAIRGLLKVDPDEALKHLETLFFSKDHDNKMAAIQNSFFFPFAEVKSVVLKFFAAESDPMILDRAGLLFQVNPDVEVPFRLWEIAEFSPPRKTTMIKKILTQAFHCIEHSGILQNEFPAYKARLQTWIQQRSATRLVHEVITRLDNDQETPDYEFDALVRKNLIQPMVRAAFEEALTWVVSTAVREKVEAYLGKMPAPGLSSTSLATPSSAPLAGEIPRPRGEFKTMTLDGKIQALTLLDATGGADPVALIQGIFDSPESPAELQASALRTALRLEIKGFVETAATLLNRAEPRVTAAALEYLGGLDPERAFLLLGKFLQSTHPRIKSTALRLLKRFDSAQAVSMLKAMLSDPKTGQQSMALANMVYFDFSLVRELLTGFLGKPRGIRFLEQGLCLFQANPDPDNLFALFCLERTFPAEAAEKISQVRRQTVALLVKTGRLVPGQEEKIEQELTQRWQKEQNRLKGEPPAYSVKKLESRLCDQLQESLLQAVEAFIQQFGLKFIVSTSVMISLVLWLGFRTAPDAGVQKNPSTVLLPAEFLLTGIVNKVSDGGTTVLVKADDGVDFELAADSPEFSRYEIGGKIVASILPVKKKKNGLIIANLKSLVP